MKILIYENRKSDPLYLDISTPEKEELAFIYLFEYLDDEWNVYCNKSEWTKEEKDLFKKAKKGNGKAAKELLTLHRSYEYEEWTVGDVLTLARNKK